MAIYRKELVVEYSIQRILDYLVLQLILDDPKNIPNKAWMDPRFVIVDLVVIAWMNDLKPEDYFYKKTIIFIKKKKENKVWNYFFYLETNFIRKWPFKNGIVVTTS